MVELTLAPAKMQNDNPVVSPKRMASITVWGGLDYSQKRTVTQLMSVDLSQLDTRRSVSSLINYPNAI